MTDIMVQCNGRREDGWTCTVVIRDGDRDLSTHQVRVTAGDLERLAPDAADPTPLVERSFAFLLERESAQSILRSFDLIVIGRYFPEYEAEIHRRMDERR